VVLAISGDLDITCADQVTTLSRQQIPSDAQAVVDLSALTFLDSSGLGALVQLWKAQQRGGGSMILVGADYKRCQVLWITGLADRIPRADSVEAVLARRS
jgi:anti-sigma B factor antagonist